MPITYKKMSLNQKSTYYYILCYFPIQFCVSLCIGCTGKRSGISVKGLRKFLSSEGLCCLCVQFLSDIVIRVHLSVSLYDSLIRVFDSLLVSVRGFFSKFYKTENIVTALLNLKPNSFR